FLPTRRALLGPRSRLLSFLKLNVARRLALVVRSGLRSDRLFLVVRSGRLFLIVRSGRLFLVVRSGRLFLVVRSGLGSTSSSSTPAASPSSPAQAPSPSSSAARKGSSSAEQEFQTIRTRTVLLFIVLAASLFGTAGTEEQEPPQPGCDEILRDTCSKSATPLDVTCSIIGFIGSALVIMFPSWRLWCMFHGPEDIIGDRWFMVFLLVGTADYAAWVGYAFRGCGYCQATPYMKGISVLGCVFTLILSLIGLARDKGRLTAGDYSEFSKLQVSVSIIGAVGFLCLRHPHLVAAIPYWVSL
ncbi:hypothetical protein EJB05_54554, partial [Eragrostis curvula]